MKKRITAILLTAAMAISLAACGGDKGSQETPASAPESDPQEEAPQEAEETPAPGGETYSWNFSTTYASGSVVVQMYERFAELCNEYTDGAITVSVFPDGIIASEDDALAQVSSGELEFCGTGTAPIFTYSAEDGWFNSPFMITDLETYKKVYDSDYWLAIREGWATYHNVLDLCGPFYRGMRTLTTSREVKNVSDLKGVKLRMNSSALWNAAWQACGATTVPVALSELYTSFQTGVVDATEIPLADSGLLNIPEVASYVVQTNHVCECAGIFMSNELFESLPAEYQEAVRKAGQDAMAECESLIADEEATWLQNYIDAGATVVEDVDIESFREASDAWWQEMFATEWTNISYEDCMALIESCSE